jgi:hypothetical protein
VEFEDLNGVRRQVEAAVGYDEALALGTRLPVYFPESHPEAAVVGGESFWLPPLGLFAMGVFSSVFGVPFILLARWIEYRWPGVLKRA